jgi:hypothetical protein
MEEVEMKNYLLGILLSFVISGIRCQEKSLWTGKYIHEFFNVTTTTLEVIDDNRISFYGNREDFYRNDAKGDKFIKNGFYTLSEENGIDYLSVLWDDDKTIDKYLMIAGSGFCYLYNADGYPFFMGIHSNLNFEWHKPYGLAHSVSASSSLVEDSVIYCPDNIDAKIGKCWAEGVRGQGIHERIIIDKDMRVNFKNIFISIGFVSYNKPYLYRQNSRPKKIRITIDGKGPIINELKDTPNFQPLVLPNGYTGNIILEILEVYEGTKYEDTCVNDLLFCFLDGTR